MTTHKKAGPMNYIALDLEWNQGPTGKPTGSLPFEIIEIGAVKLNSRMEVVDEFDECIHPHVYKKLHRIIREITHLTADDLANARGFSEVAEDFINWCGEDFLFCTWGSQDLTEFQRNLEYFGMESPWSWPLYYYDVQKIYSLNFDDGKTRVALETAVAERGIPEDIPFHRAIADTQYTAKVMQLIDWEKMGERISIDYYRLPETRQEEIYLRFGGYTKYVSREFPDKEAAMRDKNVIETRCFVCGRPLIRKIRWFSAGSRSYLSACQCPEHGYMRGKIRIRKGNFGGVYVVKTQRPSDPEEFEQIRIRKDEMREKRRLRRRHDPEVTSGGENPKS